MSLHGLNPSLKMRFRKSQSPLTTILQTIVLLLGLLTFMSYVNFIPEYYDKLVTKCLLQGCGIYSPAPPTTEDLLHASGLSVSSYAVLFVIIDTAFTLLFACAACLIAIKGRREPMALLGSIMLISFGATFPQLVHTASQDQQLWGYWFSCISTMGWISLFLFICLFPNGRFMPKWTIIPVIVFASVKIISEIFKDTALDHNYWPLPIVIALFVIPIGALIYSQHYRYRACLNREQRQQTKWIVYGFSASLIAFVVISLFFEPSLYDTPVAFVYLNGFLHLFLLILPLTLTFGILRKRLWDVDPVVKRTLVYFLLSACIVALYSLSIVFFGKMFHSENRFLPSLISTVVVAILFAPLKERLQRSVNRMMKGRHDDPFGMLSDLRSLLVKPLPPEEMLDTIVRFIRQSLRIPYAAIAVEVKGIDRIASSDSDGEDITENQTFRIIHRGEEVGALIVANRPGEPFTSEDLRLLDVLLGHAGPIIENFTMTSGMRLLAEDLQRSREKLVIAREEERRMIRRNLHDELAPRLAALGLNATAAEMYVRRDPEAATELLSELRQVIRSTVEDIRTLVHDMRPASLDEWGLVGAIQQRIEELTRPIRLLENEQGTTSGLNIEFRFPQHLPALPAAAEVAAYWIATESIANVARHSQATQCTVRLAMTSDEILNIEIIDNGIGIDELRIPFANGGIGISSIRERASELGGLCTIERLQTGGTRVAASIPVLTERGNPYL
ncbi:GAF domain-containing sensor histidine kinase [Cohnella herbarum]|uniref:histidine kinase n=1 Tax=Cohnella herbarum TaxID=2728023 RepID=A0A7Z2VFL4_9BACL|nr:histidine kinase [Cohnella herbarum]QJD82217.1 sensor histidine kinase [Cohnella herbarum]